MEVVSPQRQDEVVEFIRGLVAIHYACSSVRALLHKLLPHADASLLHTHPGLLGDQLHLVLAALLQQQVELGCLKAQVRRQGQCALLIPAVQSVILIKNSEIS